MGVKGCPLIMSAYVRFPPSMYIMGVPYAIQNVGKLVNYNSQ